jgi:hypothetical protein
VVNADRVWGSFVAVFGLTFAVIEAKALREREGAYEDGEKPPATLTAWLRRHGGIDPHKSRRVVTVPLFIGFLVWFGGHIVLGWKP